MEITFQGRIRRTSKPRACPHVASYGTPFAPADLLIVALGASEGGFEACRKLIEAMPDETVKAFTFVQLFHPNHDSLPRSAVATGEFERTLKFADFPAAPTEYLTGGKHRDLRHAKGHPRNRLPGMLAQETRSRMWAAVQQARLNSPHVFVGRLIVDASRVRRHDTVDAYTLTNDGEDLLLVARAHAKTRRTPLPRLAAPGRHGVLIRRSHANPILNRNLR